MKCINTFLQQYIIVMWINDRRKIEFMVRLVHENLLFNVL